MQQSITSTTAVPVSDIHGVTLRDRLLLLLLLLLPPPPLPHALPHF